MYIKDIVNLVSGNILFIYDGNGLFFYESVLLDWNSKLVILVILKMKG